MRCFPATALLLAVFCGGCAVGPAYHAPEVNSASAFAELNPSVNTNEPVVNWWREFHDDELDRLISEALRSNYDLQIAAVRIRESRLQRNLAAADLFPTVDANGSYIHARGSKNVVLPLGGGAGASPGQAKASPKMKSDADNSASGGGGVGANPLSNPPNPFGQGGLPGATTDLYQTGFDASWEIDVFGGKRRQVEAAAAQVAATVERRYDLQVSLAAEVARDYLELRGSQERLRIARENLASQSNILTLTRSKQSVGLVSDFDAIRAASEIAETASTIPPLEAACRQFVHSLSTLIGREPNNLSAELTQVQPLPANPPEVPVGLPSQLLARRPDIQEAERQMRAATARIGAAQADLFPKFALIGSAGLDSTSPENLFNWESRYFLISPTVTWRIFDAGRIFSNIQLQQANEQEARLQYQGTILKALREVEDALVNYATELNRRNQLADELKQNTQAMDLARQSYEQGLTDFLNVLDAERGVFSAQDALARSNVSVAADLVALYKALGGGWK